MTKIRRNLFQWSVVCLFLGALLGSFVKEASWSVWLIVAGVVLFVLDIVCDYFVKESTDDKKNIKRT
jgi:protein-S-isoprenylcysteine O-methyltransferase Ste14